MRRWLRGWWTLGLKFKPFLWSVKRHNLPIIQLEQLLDFEGFGGVDIPYIGYTELTLNILEIEGFRREILTFVQNDSKYSEEVPLIIGTLHINENFGLHNCRGVRKVKPSMVCRGSRESSISKKSWHNLRRDL